MAKMDSLYEKFTSAERTALLVEAFARRDVHEVDRLINTAETKFYEITEAQERVRELHMLALYTRVRVLQLTLGSVMYLLARSLEQRGKPLDGISDADEAEDPLEERMVEGEECALGIWAAWREFCESIGVDAEKAISIGSEGNAASLCGGLAALLGGEAMSLLEANDEARKEMLELFEHRWERVKGRRH